MEYYLYMKPSMDWKDNLICYWILLYLIQRLSAGMHFFSVMFILCSGVEMAFVGP